MGDNADKHSKATRRMEISGLSLAVLRNIVEASPGTTAVPRPVNRTVCQALADLHSKIASDAKSNHASHLGELGAQCCPGGIGKRALCPILSRSPECYMRSGSPSGSPMWSRCSATQQASTPRTNQLSKVIKRPGVLHAGAGRCKGQAGRHAFASFRVRGSRQSAVFLQPFCEKPITRQAHGEHIDALKKSHSTIHSTVTGSKARLKLSVSWKRLFWAMSRAGRRSSTKSSRSTTLRSASAWTSWRRRGALLCVEFSACAASMVSARPWVIPSTSTQRSDRLPAVELENLRNMCFAVVSQSSTHQHVANLSHGMCDVQRGPLRSPQELAATAAKVDAAQLACIFASAH